MAISSDDYILTLEDDIYFPKLEEFYTDLTNILNSTWLKFSYFKFFHISSISNFENQHLGQYELVFYSFWASLICWLPVILISKKCVAKGKSSRKIQFLSFTLLFLVAFYHFKSYGRLRFYNYLYKNYHHKIYTRAWRACTPIVLYTRHTAAKFSQLLLNYNYGLHQYDDLLWFMDIYDMLQFKSVGMMMQPNSVIHGMARTTHELH